MPKTLAAAITLLLMLGFCFGTPAWARSTPREKDGGKLLASVVNRWADLLEPAESAPARTLTAKLKVVTADGLPKQAAGATADIIAQAPDLVRLSAVVAGQTYTVARDGQQVWVHEPDLKFALLGKNGIPRFKADPASVQDVTLAPFALPISRFKLRVVLFALNATVAGEEKVDGVDCDILDISLKPTAVELLHLPAGARAKIWIRQSDLLPARVVAQDGKGISVEVDLSDVALTDPVPAERWKLKPNAGDKVETVALSHLVKFAEVAPRLLNQKTEPLGPATGRREVVAVSGNGRLEQIDGTRVLFLKGSPEEMGRQHGELLKSEAQAVAEKILYGVGVGSSFIKGNWFFGEIEGAEARLQPHMDERYLREMDAIAAATGMHPQEARLANFFPELFHCSGFALMGKATADGHLYHGRVLDYMKGVGLEQGAVVMVYQPDGGRNAWVNLGYAGFIGSVTAMNEKGISIGEMGGRGYGDWDGKPMAHLVREVMEKASTLDEAIALMRKSPRTCEYYYVISDGKAKTAVAVAATPQTLQILKPGEVHERLPHKFEDAVVLSAGQRYEALSQRVSDGYGHFTADSARALMSRPVCMTSNIQSVLFRPDTLDFWVANADGEHVAGETRYTQYNLKTLLQPPAEHRPSLLGF